MKNNLRTKFFHLALASAVTISSLAGMPLCTERTATAADTAIDGSISKETSTELSYNTDYRASLQYKNDSDWFFFTPQIENGFYELTIENYNIQTGGNYFYGFCMDVYDENGSLLITSDTQMTESITYRFKLADKTQKYYLYFYMGGGCLAEGSDYACTGNYHVDLKYIKDDVADTQDESATELTLRNEITGNLEGYVTDNSGKTKDDSAKWTEESLSDVDVYKFTAPEDGTYTFSVTNCNIEGIGNDAWKTNMTVTTEYGQQLHTCAVETNKTVMVPLELEKDCVYYLSIQNGLYIPQNLGTYKAAVYDSDYIDALAAPEDLTVKAGKKKVTIKWEKEALVKSYYVYRSKNGGTYKKIAAVSKGKYVDKKVSSGKNYSYKVKAAKLKGGINVLSAASESESVIVTVK